MKKVSFLILALLFTISMVTCAQKYSNESTHKKQLLFDESPLLTTTDAEMGIFLKAMKTDSMIEKLELLSRFIQNNSDNNSLDEYTNKALAFTSLKRYDSAIYYFTLAINLNNRDPYLYYFRGDTYSKKHNFMKAIDDFTHAINLDQNFYMAFDIRWHLIFFKDSNKNSSAEVLAGDSMYFTIFLRSFRSSLSSNLCLNEASAITRISL